MDLWKSLQIIRQRKWVFLGAVLLAVAVVAATPRGRAVDPVYVSTAKVLLTPQSNTASLYGHGQDVGMASVTAWFSDQLTVNELVNSEELLRRVADRAGEADQWQSMRGRITMAPLGAEKGEEGRYYNPRSPVSIFQIKAVDQTPEKAQELAAIFSDEFVTYVQDLSAREYANTRRFLEEMMSEAQAQVEGVEKELVAMRDKHMDALALDPSTGASVVEKRQMLEGTAARLREESSLLQSQIASVQRYLDGSTSAPPWTVLEGMDTSVQSLKAAVAQHELQLLELEAVYTPESQKIKDQKARLAQVRDLFDRQLDTQVTSLLQEKMLQLQEKQSQIASVQFELNAIAKAQMSPEEKRDLAKLERELGMWEENLLGLTKQHYNARVVEQASRRQGAISVLENPGPGAPTGGFVPESVYKTLLTAFPFCLFFGVCMALLVDYLNTSFQIRPRVEETLELPVIGIIPHVSSDLSRDWERIKRGELVAVGAPNGRNGYTNGHGNGHANGKNGYTNGHGNGHANGKNGYTNGHGGNGYTNGHGPNGHTNGDGQH